MSNNKINKIIIFLIIDIVMEPFGIKFPKHPHSVIIISLKKTEAKINVNIDIKKNKPKSPINLYLVTNKTEKINSTPDMK